MKPFRTLLLCLTLAVLGALAWQTLADDPGQVIVRLRGTVYVTTVGKAMLLLIVGMTAIGALALLLRLPFQWWRRNRERQALARLGGGLQALHEGRWARAEKLLLQAAAHPPLQTCARLAAAQAAQARGDAPAAEQHLVAAQSASGAALARAQAQIEAGQPEQALASLDAIAEGNLPPRALLLRVQALLAAHRAEQACTLLGALKGAQVLADTELTLLEARASAQALHEAVDADALNALRDHLPATLCARDDVVSAYVARALELHQPDAAAEAVEGALNHQWDEALALTFGRIPDGPDTPPGARLKTAEHWLGAHADSPGLAVSLGRLSAGRALWDKAEAYLLQAIAHGGGGAAWEELGHVFVAGKDDLRARICYANALRAARGETLEPLPAH